MTKCAFYAVFLGMPSTMQTSYVSARDISALISERKRARNFQLALKKARDKKKKGKVLAKRRRL